MKQKIAKETALWRNRPLQVRPGFLIRRLHQIHLALFTEECTEIGITTVQYSVLTALDQLGAVEQIVLARAIGLDRTNTADVVARLERRGYCSREVSATDKRMKIVAITAAGQALLEQAEQGAARAHSRTLEALSAREQEQFLAMMLRLVEANNVSSRAPVSLSGE
ncbi:MarR family transcriptional regulator [Sphingomonas naphthae]|uniref:MarR family transcriptional regulator n=1 Tax=Sphingomonas naphthae TaxID=1813468 RepID=A0ABY7TJ82_9SPHN|nr:MarR family transcriptional regulator [Sphingomonas naphthae]WCT73093.1 MarR family transcriptional regulator [Sphingomonas naphthae]